MIQALDAADHAIEREHVERSTLCGLSETRPELVAGDELLSLEPSLAPDLVACRLDIGYPVVPGSATRAYAALARRLGAKIVTGAATLATDGGSATGVDVDGRQVAAGSVVVAAGPWTPEVVSGRGSAGSVAWPPIGRSWGVNPAQTFQDYLSRGAAAGAQLEALEAAVVMQNNEVRERAAGIDPDSHSRMVANGISHSFERT